MKLTRKSLFTGKSHTMELDISEDDYRNWLKGSMSIQNAFPHLTPDEREFILTGCTSEEWDEMFSEDELVEDEY